MAATHSGPPENRQAWMCAFLLVMYERKVSDLTNNELRMAVQYAETRALTPAAFANKLRGAKYGQ
jgi:hypothetical protein